ncbi:MULTISPECIES: hypothetical protein, partial [Methylobacter]
MKEPVKFCRNAYWLAFLLLASGGLGALGIAVSSGFSMTGWVMAAALISATGGLGYWSRNRYRMALRAIEQGLFDTLQRQNEQSLKALQDAHHEAVLLAGGHQVEAERKHLKTLITDLAHRFDALPKRLGGPEEEKTEQSEAAPVSVEAQIADLAQRFDALLSHLDQQPSGDEQQEHG